MILVLLGAAAGAAWYLMDSSRHTTYQIRTHDPVSGLIADSPVEFHGVEVGKVKRVELTDPRTVTVWLSIRKDAPVSTATVATITGRGLATRGFTGYVYVSLEDVGSDARPLARAPDSPFPLIPTADSRSVNLDTAISQLNQNVQSMTDLLQSLLDRKTIASLQQSADGLQRVTTMLQAQVLPETYRTLVKLDQLSTSLGDLVAKIKRDPSVVIRGSSAPPAPGESK